MSMKIAMDVASLPKANVPVVGCCGSFRGSGRAKFRIGGANRQVAPVLLIFGRVTCANEDAMTESATDSAAVQNAYRDIDRYISETTQPTNDGQLLSPSRRLRALGMQKAGSSKPSDAPEIATLPSASEF
jgi:hypothetical protein